MPLDAGALGRGCKGADVRQASQLCRSQIDRFEAALEGARAITVGCTQEAPVFSETADAAGFAGDLTFVNIREAAGWSTEGAGAGPKMAALLAAAAEPTPPTALVPMESRGVTLIYGRDETALEAARLLADRLDVTVLLTRPGEVAPPRRDDVPIYRGTIRAAQGWLGGFELTVDDFAEPAVSSRAALRFGPPRDGASSSADIIVDLSGGAPLFPAHELRSGYVRADPADPSGLARAVFDASGLVGTFDKPRYVDYRAHLCAHSRSKIVGCTRCLEVCPTGAITPAGDHVAVSAEICAGCGSCAAVCPTGAASYALPPADALMRRLRTMLAAYHEAGGQDAILLLHDDKHGGGLIEALGRFGEGLPANVLPLTINEPAQVGLEAIAAALAYGAHAVRFVLPAKPKHDPEAVRRTVQLANLIGSGLGYGEEPAGVIETDDPDALLAAVRALKPNEEKGGLLRSLLPSALLPSALLPTTWQGSQGGDECGARRRSAMLPTGDKRSVLVQSVRALHEVAPSPVDVVALPRHAPFGTLDIDVEGCTLCLSCVAACPTGALQDNPERPQLKFAEDACVQCGLCANTCPERVITLHPRLSFAAINAPAVLVKEEEPFPCTACGKPFGTRSAVERVIAKLEGRHWMFSGQSADRLQALRMCEDCRVGAVTGSGLDPYAGPERAPPRTSDDYLREREQRGRETG